MNRALRFQNPWPAAIIAIFACFIAATAGLVAFSAFHQEDLVSEDYYEQELKYQNQIDRMNLTRAIRPQMAITYDHIQQQIKIMIPAAHARRHPKGKIHFYRPSAAGLDRQKKLDCGIDGVQTLDATTLKLGLWKVRVFWTIDQQEFFYDQPVVIARHRSSP